MDANSRAVNDVICKIFNDSIYQVFMNNFQRDFSDKGGASLIKNFSINFLDKKLKVELNVKFSILKPDISECQIDSFFDVFDDSINFYLTIEFSFSEFNVDIEYSIYDKFKTILAQILQANHISI
jgi:hypothetical protein